MYDNDADTRASKTVQDIKHTLSVVPFLFLDRKPHWPFRAC